MKTNVQEIIGRNAHSTIDGTLKKYLVIYHKKIPQKYFQLVPNYCQMVHLELCPEADAFP